MGEIKNSFSVQCRNANIAKERLKNTMLKEIKKDMRKLLNKLFEWLGYVPKIQLYKAKEQCLNVLLFKKQIVKEQQVYTMSDAPDYNCYVVTILGVANYRFHKRVVKSFPYGDDKEYAKLCAEELCEMLNQKI